MPTSLMVKEKTNLREKILLQTLSIRRYFEISLVRAGFRFGIDQAAGTLVLASSGNLNIGDVAMYQSLVKNVSGRITVLATIPESYHVSADRSEEVKVLRTRMIDGSGCHRIRAYFALGRLLRGSTAMVVIGADNLDGGYGSRFASYQWTGAIAAAKLGVSTRMAGFSWSSRPTPTATKCAITAAKVGVQLLPRDPISMERLPPETRRVSIQAADMAFLLGEADVSSTYVARIRQMRELGYGTFILNISGLIHARTDLTLDYRKILSELNSKGYYVLIVPHVGGQGNDDRISAKIITAGIDLSHVEFVDRLLTPEQIKGIVAEADLVLTGRMHLAILSLSAGTPAMVLTTQGKVEGLLNAFDIDTLLVHPEAGFAAQVISIIRAQESHSLYRQKIQKHLPIAKDQASENFNGL